MTSVKHPVTGHELTTDDDSVEFWKAAGYVFAGDKKSPKKAPAKKAASKSDKK